MEEIEEEKVGVKSPAAGFALTEVLVALVIIGILLSFSLRFFSEQWRVTQEAKDRMEAHFAVLNAGRTVLDAIRESQSVTWVSPGTLQILPWKQQIKPDLFYIADKDYDGIKDLYIEHEGVPNPISSRIVGWNCTKGETGLWTITLQAQVGRQSVNWTGKIRQRAFPDNIPST